MAFPSYLYILKILNPIIASSERPAGQDALFGGGATVHNAGDRILPATSEPVDSDSSQNKLKGLVTECTGGGSWGSGGTGGGDGGGSGGAGSGSTMRWFKKINPLKRKRGEEPMTSIYGENVQEENVQENKRRRTEETREKDTVSDDEGWRTPDLLSDSTD